MKRFHEIIDELCNDGWCSIETCPCANLLEFASDFGKPIASSSKRPFAEILHVTPAKEARPRSLSATYGEGAFPWHTDMAHIRVPPRFTILRSLSDAGIRPTYLLDSKQIYQTSDEEAVLRNEIWLVNGGRGRFLTPILNNTISPGVDIFRYDSCVMRSVESSSLESVRLMKAIAVRKASAVVEWLPGLCVIFDNWRMLHARAPRPIGTEPYRVLERVLVTDRGGVPDVLGLRWAMAKV
jgi:L-asparagine oxygenase